jgi:hypothetical protein
MPMLVGEVRCATAGCGSICRLSGGRWWSAVTACAKKRQTMCVTPGTAWLTAWCAALTLACAAPASLAQPAAAAKPARLADVRMTAGTTTITAELLDHATSRDFLHRLPITVRMTRSGEREYHGRPDKALSVDGPKQTRFENGDLGYWAPGGYLAIFLDKTVKPNITDLIVLGKVTSDLAAVQRMGASFDMTIEHVRGP